MAMLLGANTFGFMITVAEATDIVLQASTVFGVEELDLRAAFGRILARPIYADRDFPPFTRVSMDGVAIRYASFAAGQRRFAIEGVLGAGSEPGRLLHPDRCWEVMTGAVLPEGADTVIRYEDLEVGDGWVEVRTGRVAAGQNAHPQGSDRRKGDLLVPAGRRLSPAEAGIAATVGQSRLAVARLPKTIILYTGDELVGIDQLPMPHQIRASNVFTIAATLSNYAIDAELSHLPDDRQATTSALERALSEFQLVILSGGISKGKFDYVPSTLESLGVRRHFQGVAQKPGKPFWFGTGINDTTVFALPGNPVAAFMCTLRYVQPWLRKGLGLEPIELQWAMLAGDLAYAKPQSYFVPATTSFNPQGQLVADLREGRGSGDLANLADADGFIELPPEKTVYKEGEIYPFIPYR